MKTQSEEIIIECEENCGNAPKKELLKDYTVSFVKQDVEFCLEWLTDNIEWNIIGHKQVYGKDDCKKTMNDINHKGVKHLRIHNIITHGNVASVNGIVTVSEKESYAFCDVYNFAGFGKKAKIKKITSYVIKTS